MAVRYDQKFMNEIRRTVNAYNRKINRLSKLDTNYILPEKFSAESLRALKATATTRGEVRRRLKDLQAFTERGGEKNISVKGATLPRYQYSNIKRYRKILGSQLKSKMRKYETTHPITKAKEEPYTFSQYGSQEYLTLKAKYETLLSKDISVLSPDEVKNYLNKLMANVQPKKMDVWQNNYIDILQDTALSYGYDTEKLEYIVEKLRSLNPQQFDDISFISRNVKQVMYAYKALENIETIKELTDVGEDVISNLDALYESIDDIINLYG